MRRALVLFLVVASAPAAGQTLAPHEAQYRMSIGGGAGGSQLTGGGVATVRFEKTCKEWRMSVAMKLAMAAGKQRISTSVNLAVVESLDGKSYESRVVATAGKVVEKGRTVARLGAGGGTATVTASAGTRTVRLPSGTRFPVSHARHSLARAAAGETSIRGVVFDYEGSGQLMIVTDKFTSLPAPPLGSLAPALKSPKVYRVHTTAFSRRDASSGTAKKGIEQIVLGTGVALIMRARMSGLQLTGKLVSATPLKTPDCPSN